MAGDEPTAGSSETPRREESRETVTLALAGVVLVAAVLVAVALASGGALGAASGADRPSDAGGGPSALDREAGHPGVVTPDAVFEWEPRQPTPGDTVEFDARASGDDGRIVEYRWDFDGDGVDDRETSRPLVEHTYEESGEYEVRLVVVDDDGETDVLTRTVTVAPPAPTPTARCSVSTERTTVGETVTVDATATENATRVRFDFDGDGSFEALAGTGEEFRVTTTYDTPDRYTVRVRAIGAGQVDDATCGRVTVLSNDPPTVSLSVPASATAGRAARLNATATDDGTVAAYRWDFDGDGTVDRVTETGVVEHTYPDPGEYEVRVTAVDGTGLETTAGATLTVDPPASPMPDCRLSVTEAGVGDPVGLDASGSENVERLRVDRDGDGTADLTLEDDRTVTLTYESPGEYRPAVVGVGAGDDTVTAECGIVTVLAGGTETTGATGPDAGPDGGGGLPVDPLWLLVAGGIAVAVVAVALLRRVGGGAAATGDDGDGGADAAGNGTDPDEGGEGDAGLDVEFDPETAGAEMPDDAASGAMLGMGGAETLRVPGAVEHASDSVDLPAGGGEVVVDDVGFQPDAIRLTAASEGTGGESAWSHGAVAAGESVTQHVVAIGDVDADRVSGAAGEGTAVELPVGEDETGGVHGRVSSLDEDGFTLDLSAASGDEGAAGGDAEEAIAGRLWYHAVSLSRGMAATVGSFEIDESGDYQSVPVSLDADYAALTAVREGGADTPVALSHGHVADDRDHLIGEGGDTAPEQWAVGSAVDAIGHSAFGGGDGRVVHLPTPGDDEGRSAATRVRARSLARTLDLAVESRAGDRPGGVLYLALDLDGTAPTVATADPDPADPEGTPVETGTEAPTALVTGVANGGVADGEGRTVPGGLPRLGWSHGVAGVGRDQPTSHVLPVGPATGGPPALVRVPAVDDEGRIVGRATVGVRFGESGVRLVSLDAPQTGRPVVFYTAWSRLE